VLTKKDPSKTNVPGKANCVYPTRLELRKKVAKDNKKFCKEYQREKIWRGGGAGGKKKLGDFQGDKG